MQVNKIDNKQNITVATLSTVGTGAVAAGIGYSTPLFNNKGVAKDTFVSLVENRLSDFDKELCNKRATVIQELKVLPESKGKIDRKALKNCLIKNAEILNIEPKQGQTIEKAVDNLILFKKSADIKNQIIKDFEKLNNLKSDFKSTAKEYINLTYDTKAKSFRKATEELPQTAINFIKSAMAKTKKIQAIKYGVVGTLTAASVSAIAFLTANHRSS